MNMVAELLGSAPLTTSIGKVGDFTEDEAYESYLKLRVSCIKVRSLQPEPPSTFVIVQHKSAERRSKKKDAADNAKVDNHELPCYYVHSVTFGLQECLTIAKQGNLFFFAV